MNTLDELKKAWKNNELVDTNYYTFYLTKEHEENNKMWWSNGLELRCYFEASEKIQHNLEMKIFWDK